MYFNMSQLFHNGSITSSTYSSSPAIRSAVFAVKYSTLSLTFFPNITSSSSYFTITGKATNQSMITVSWGGVVWALAVSHWPLKDCPHLQWEAQSVLLWAPSLAGSSSYIANCVMVLYSILQVNFTIIVDTATINSTLHVQRAHGWSFPAHNNTVSHKV